MPRAWRARRRCSLAVPRRSAQAGRVPKHGPRGWLNPWPHTVALGTSAKEQPERFLFSRAKQFGYWVKLIVNLSILLGQTRYTRARGVPHFRKQQLTT